MFRVQLLGPFDVYDDLGQSVCPKGRKDCGLIALLALSPSHRQTRKWLQDKLWSDRAEEQGAASLRQSLSKLRGAFGHQAVQADRSHLWLDPEFFTFDLGDAKGDRIRQEELLQGMDVPDPAFEEWLRLERSAFVRENHSPAKPGGVVHGGAVAQRARLIFQDPIVQGGNPALAGFAQRIVDEMIHASRAMGLDQQVDGRLDLLSPIIPAPTDIRISVKLSQVGSSCLAAISATDWFGSIIWHTREEIELHPNRDNRLQTYRLCHIFLSFLIEWESNQAERDPDLVDVTAQNFTVLLGLLRAGSVDINTLARAGKRGLELNPSGLSVALDAFVQVFRFGEQPTQDRMTMSDLAERFALAQRLAPDNGLVLSLAGHASSFIYKDVERGLMLTEAGIRLSPGNGYCWALRALSLLYAGDFDRAHRLAMSVYRMCAYTIAAPFAETVCAMVALVRGEHKRAIKLARSSHTILPNFRASALVLCSAYALDGKLQQGRSVLEGLKRNDPNLSLSSLAAPDYPIVNDQQRQLILTGARRLGLR